MIYQKIFEMLATKQIRYVVVGGVAVIFHGIGRNTGDLDLIVGLEKENVLRFTQGMTEIGLFPKVPVKTEEFADSVKRESWIQEKGMKVFSFHDPKDPYILVDVFVYEPIDFRELEREKVEFNIHGVKIPVVSRRHLKQLKKMSGRPLDLADIDSLTTLEELEEDDRRS